MAYWTATDHPPADEDRARLAEADVYLLLAGFRYGSLVPEQPEVSYTELEFLTAGELGIPRLVFLLAEQTHGPAGLFIDLDNGRQQERFRQQLQRSGRVTGIVDSPDRTETLVHDALIRLGNKDSRHADSIWAIPAALAVFTGRESLLADLRHILITHTRATVHGMAGCGKTSIATEYARRHAEEYEIAWWIRAERPDLIPDQLSMLAQAMGLATPEDPTPAAVARLLGTLRQRHHWLLVLDNAPNVESVVGLLPQGGGHLLITSRNPHWHTLAPAIAVDEFTRTESISLLRSRIPTMPDADAQALAAAVGDLPLVLDQAAALLADTGLAASTYLELLRDRADVVLAHRTQASGYPASIAAAWRVTFDQLADTDQAALQLLSLAAWLAPEPIPLSLFLNQTSQLPEPLASAAADPLSWAQLLGRLRQRALARISADSLLLHRVPGALLRTDSPAAAPRGAWSSSTIRLLRDVVPADPWDEPSTWPRWGTILAHVLQVTDPTRPAGPASDDVDWLLDRMAGYLHARGEPHRALPHFRRAYSDYLSRLGPDHPDTLNSANHLANALRDTGELESARDLNQDTFDRRRRVLGEDHPDTLRTAGNLSTDLFILAEYEQAHRLDQDTLERFRRIQGNDDPGTIAAAGYLAADLHSLGDYMQARELHHDTLARFRRVLGHDHPATLHSATNLADTLCALGEHAQARALHEDTLARRRHVLGVDHPATLRSAYYLANTLHEQGEYELARELHQDTFERSRRVLGESHHHTRQVADSLARDLDALGVGQR